MFMYDKHTIDINVHVMCRFLNKILILGITHLKRGKLGPVKTYRANSGAVRFRVLGSIVRFVLSSMDDVHRNIFKIVLSLGSRRFGVLKYYGKVVNDPEESDDDDCPLNTVKEFDIPRPPGLDGYSRYWLTWKNNEFKLGLQGQEEPFYKYPVSQTNIGYIKFETPTSSLFPVNWIYEAPPSIREIKTNNFEDGQLCWRRMDGHLPPEAMIGGFENELIYIARAGHRGSLCPGKFVPSKQAAFVAWGRRAHEKNEFEILCGYNARWVKTKGNAIPENAYIGGYSEVYGEPLYIGRAMIDYNLICGKVHLLYNTCYLPYEEKEVEVHSYEVLVMPYVLPRGEPMFIE